MLNRGVAAVGLCLATMAAPAIARGLPNPPRGYDPQSGMQIREDEGPREGQVLVEKAVKTVENLSHHKGMRGLVRQARGIFLVPRFARGGFIVGGRSGEGLLLVHRKDGSWSDPVFYGLGGATIGAQAGGAKGETAYILMNGKALKRFEKPSGVSLDANAAYTVQRFTEAAHAGWSGGDVVVWSNTAGIYFGASIGATEISYDAEKTKAYYPHQAVTIARVLDGKVTTASDDELQALLKAM